MNVVSKEKYSYDYARWTIAGHDTLEEKTK